MGMFRWVTQACDVLLGIFKVLCHADAVFENMAIIWTKVADTAQSRGISSLLDE